MILDLESAFANEVNAYEPCGRIRAYETLGGWADEEERDIAAKIAWERWPMEQDYQAKAVLIRSLSQLLDDTDPRLLRLYIEAAAHTSQDVRTSADQLFVQRCPLVFSRRLAAALIDVEAPLESMVPLACQLYTNDEDRPILIAFLKRAIIAGCENAWPKLHALLRAKLPSFLRELTKSFKPEPPVPIWFRTLTGFALRRQLLLRRGSQEQSAEAEWWSFPENHRTAMLKMMRALWSLSDNFKYVGGTADLTAGLVRQRHELGLDTALARKMIRCQEAADVAVEALIEDPSDSILKSLASSIFASASILSKMRAAEHWASDLLPPLPDRLNALRMLSRRCRARDRDSLVKPWCQYLRDAHELVGDCDAAMPVSSVVDPVLILFAHVRLASRLLRFGQLMPLKASEARRLMPSLTYIDSDDFSGEKPPTWILAGAAACSSERSLPFSFAETAASMGGWRWDEAFAVTFPAVAFPGFLGVETPASKDDLSRLLAQIVSPISQLSAVVHLTSERSENLG